MPIRFVGDLSFNDKNIKGDLSPDVNKINSDLSSPPRKLKTKESFKIRQKTMMP